MYRCYSSRPFQSPSTVGHLTAPEIVHSISHKPAPGVRVWNRQYVCSPNVVCFCVLRVACFIDTWTWTCRLSMKEIRRRMGWTLHWRAVFDERRAFAVWCYRWVGGKDFIYYCTFGENTFPTDYYKFITGFRLKTLQYTSSATYMSVLFVYLFTVSVLSEETHFRPIQTIIIGFRLKMNVGNDVL